MIEIGEVALNNLTRYDEMVDKVVGAMETKEDDKEVFLTLTKQDFEKNKQKMEKYFA